MLDHFSRSELACPATDQVRLTSSFGEALERLRVKLDEPNMEIGGQSREPLHQ